MFCHPTHGTSDEPLVSLLGFRRRPTGPLHCLLSLLGNVEGEPGGGQVAMQPAMRREGQGSRAVLGRRLWPWLMAAMLVAAWVVP